MQSLDLKDDRKEPSNNSYSCYKKIYYKANEWGWVWPTPAQVVDTTQQYLQFKGPNARTYSDVGVSKLI